MAESKIYDVPEAFARNANLNAEQYEAMYAHSVEDPAGFWAEQAKQFLHWDKPWDTVLDWDYTKGDIRWFEGGSPGLAVDLLAERGLAPREGHQISVDADLLEDLPHLE